MREAHGNTISREDTEAWSAFVVRAAALTLAYLQSFKLADIVEPGDVFFNVVWVGESDYGNIHFPDAVRRNAWSRVFPQAATRVRSRCNHAGHPCG
jgi:hypothetical protein